MALFKYAGTLDGNADPAFDVIHPADRPAPFGGVYRCEGCHKEVGVARHQPLPPSGHHPHTAAQGANRWRLIVASS